MNIIKIFLTLFLVFLALTSHAFNPQEFFKNRCVACHNLSSEDKIGPGLQGVEKRRDKEWIIDFIQNSQALIKSGDPEAKELYEEWDKKIMPSFDLSDKEAAQLVEYISNPDEATQEKGPQASSSEGEPKAKDSQEAEEPLGKTILFVLLGGSIFIIASVIVIRSGHKVVISTFFTVAVLILLGFACYQAYKFARSTDYSVGYAPAQPIKFSHKTHAGENEISCLYCHYGADKGNLAVIPPVKLCMNCHKYIKKDSSEVQKIHQALKDKKSIEWEKVHYSPDFAVFNHSVHVTNDEVSCQHCHGDVQNMEVLKQKETMSMGFCLECHRGHDESFAPHSDNEKQPGVLFDCASCHY